MFGLDKLIDTDALLQSVAEHAFRRYVAPWLAELRSTLLAALAGDAPAGFPAALERAGIPDLPIDAQRAIWRAAVDAAAEVRT